MKKIQKFLIFQLVLILGFFAILLPNVKSINAAGTNDPDNPVVQTGQIAPVAQGENYNKAYYSCIPDEAYDIDNGAMSSTEQNQTIYSYFDLISEDGTTNYYLMDGRMIDLAVGDSIVFYLESAHQNWYFNGNYNETMPKTHYELSLDGSNVSYTVEEYGRADYVEQFDSNTSGGDYSFTESSSVYDTERNDSGASLEFNEYYYMPKVTITAGDAGISQLTLSCKESSEYGTEDSISFYIHTYNVTEPDYFETTIEVASDNDHVEFVQYRDIDVESTDVSYYYALPYDLNDTYRFISNYVEELPDKTINGKITISEDQMQSYTVGENQEELLQYVIFNEPGEYNLILNFKVVINDEDEIDIESRTVHFLVYSESEVDLYMNDNYISQSSFEADIDDLPYATFEAFSNEMSLYEDLEVEWTAIKEGEDNSVSLQDIDSTGNYTLTASFSNSTLSTYCTENDMDDISEFEHEWQMEVTSNVVAEDIEPELSFAEGMIISSEDEVTIALSEVLTEDFSINNYSVILANAESITYTVNNGEPVSINSLSFPIHEFSVGENQLIITVTSTMGVNEFSYNITIENDITFAIYDNETQIDTLSVELGDLDKYLSVMNIIDGNPIELLDAFTLSCEPGDGINAYVQYETLLVVEAPSIADTYNIEVLIFLNDEQVGDSLYLEVVVSEIPDVTVLLRDNFEEPVGDVLQLDLNDAERYLVYIDINGEEELIDDPYYFELSSDIDSDYAIVSSEYTNTGGRQHPDTITIDTSNAKGYFTFSINVYKGDYYLTTKEVSFRVGYEVPEYDWKMEQDGELVTGIELMPGDDFEFDVNAYFNGVQQRLDENYSFIMTIEPNEGLGYSNDIVEDVSNRFSFSAVNPGNYYFIIDILYYGENISSIEGSVLVKDNPTLVLKDKDDFETDAMSFTVDETSEMFVYFSLDGDETLIDEPYTYSISGNYDDLFSITQHDNSFTITPLSISSVGTKTLTVSLLKDGSVIDSRYLTVMINEVAYNFDWQYRFYDSEEKDYLSNSITMYHGEELTLQTVMTLLDEEEEFDERFRISYSANGEGLQYYLIDLDDDTAFTLNAFELGTYSFIAQIYYYGEYKDQIVLTVNVIEEPYSGDYDFYITDGTNEVSHLELTNIEEKTIYIYQSDGINDEPIDDDFDVYIDILNEELHISAVQNAEYNHTYNVFSSAVGNYNALVYIKYNDEVIETLPLSVTIVEAPYSGEYIFHLFDDTLSDVSTLYFEIGESQIVQIYQQSSGGELNPLSQDFEVEPLASSNLLIQKLRDEGVESNGKYSISSNVKGTYSVLFNIKYNSEVIATLTLDVVVSEPELSGYSFYFADSDGVSIFETQKLENNSSYTYYLNASGFEFDGDCRVEYESPIEIYPAHINSQIINDAIGIYTSDFSGIYYVAAKIYYKDALIDTVVMTLQIGSGEGGNKPIDLNGYFHLGSDYNVVITKLEQMEMPVYFYDYSTGQSTICTDEEFRMEFILDYSFISVSFDDSSKKIVINPYENGQASVTAIVIYDNQFVDTIRFNVRVAINRVSIETNFVEGKIVQSLLSNSELYLTVPSEYQEMIYGSDSEWFYFSTNRNIVDVLEGYEQRLMVSLINEGQCDVYFIARSRAEQLVVKSTIVVIDEEPHIDIDMKRAVESDAAVSKFDDLIFTVNTLGFQFSSNVTYEWLIDNEIKSHDASFTTKIPEGTHTVTVRFVDNTLNRHLEATKKLNITKLADQVRQLTFEENEIYLVMLKNQYDIQVLLDGMISNDYHYIWSSDNDTVSIFDNGTSKLTVLPNHAGETTIYVSVDVGTLEEKIITASVKVFVEKIESIGHELSTEFPKPGKPFDVILLVNDKKNFKNVDFEVTVKKDGEDVASDTQGNLCHITDPVTGKYEFNYRLGTFEGSGSVKVSNFNFREFLINVLPFVLVGMVIAVIAYAFITRGLNPYRNLTRTLNDLENCFTKEIEKTDSAPSNKAYASAFKKLRSKNHKLRNRINYFSDEGFDGIELALKHVITIDAIMSSLVNSMDSVSDSDCHKAIHKVYESNFKALKVVVNQTIDSQLHFQKQAIEANKDEDVKKKKAKKEKVDYKKELYKNGILEQGDTNDDNN